MRALLIALVLVLAACGDSITMTRDAATDLASVVCQRRIDCDPEYTIAFDDCVEWTVVDLCSRVDCEQPYERSNELATCLDAYASTACDMPPTICGL